MKIFICWHLDRSKAIANALFEWLPRVIQSIDPFVSFLSIDAGARWETELSQQLNSRRAGILCLVPENLNSTWIHFEAGLLSKVVGKALVVPYLHDGLTANNLEQPISAFVACESNKPGTLAMLKTLNKNIDSPLPEKILLDAFEKQWPSLEIELAKIPRNEQPAPPPDQTQLLERLLQESRATSEAIADLRSHVAAAVQSGRGTGVAGVTAAAPVGGVSATGALKATSIEELREVLTRLSIDRIDASELRPVSEMGNNAYHQFAPVSEEPADSDDTNVDR